MGVTNRLQRNISFRFEIDRCSHLMSLRGGLSAVPKTRFAQKKTGRHRSANPDSSVSWVRLDRVHDLFRQALPFPEVGPAIVVGLGDEGVVFVHPPLPFVHFLWLEAVRVIELGDGGGNEVAEIRVRFPVDRSLRYGFHCGEAVWHLPLL